MRGRCHWLVSPPVIARVGTLCLALSLLTALGAIARAADNSLSFTATSDRAPSDFAIPDANKFQVDFAHTFANRVILGASFQYQQDLFDGPESENLQGTIGYRLDLAPAFSVTGSAGIGEKFRAADDGGDFPYYLFTVAADVKITPKLTWNAIYVRFRDSFDPADDYLTPQLATGLTYNFNDRNAIKLKISRDWSEGVPSATGIGLGYVVGF